MLSEYVDLRFRGRGRGGEGLEASSSRISWEDSSSSSDGATEAESSAQYMRSFADVFHGDSQSQSDSPLRARYALGRVVHEVISVVYSCLGENSET